MLVSQASSRPQNQHHIKSAISKTTIHTVNASLAIAKQAPYKPASPGAVSSLLQGEASPMQALLRPIETQAANPFHRGTWDSSIICAAQHSQSKVNTNSADFVSM